jgi:hypothetical protein
MANSLLDGAAFFTGVAAKLEHQSKKKTEMAARIIRDEAKRVLGTYEYDWPSLAASTIERKSTGDSPGLETGKMRRSIKFQVVGTRLNWTAYIGSNDPHAKWFELGTVRQPPRSFLRGAAMRKEKEVKKILGHDLFHSAFSYSPDHEDEWSYDGED